jgi:NADPH-dependent curcumin reductase CurA
MTTLNTQVLLSSRPNEQLSADNFELKTVEVPALKQGQFLIANHYFSLDAGFRQWMNEGSDDNYLVSMPLGEAVQSIILGQVVQSLHPDYPVDSWVVGRTAWESFSIADGSDLMDIIVPQAEVELYEYLCALGPAGITAYFGLVEIGQPQAGDNFVINAAAGGVGSYAGQLAKHMGCHTVGITGGDAKCQWLQDTLGYDDTIDYKATESLDSQLQRALPEGADVVFDNVGGDMLGTLLGHLAEKARVVLCGALSQYEQGDQVGVANMWELITKRARAEGFMFSDYVSRYHEAVDYIAELLRNDQLVSPVHFSEGIASSPQAFIDMLEGRSYGKCLVRL